MNIWNSLPTEVVTASSVSRKDSTMSGTVTTIYVQNGTDGQLLVKSTSNLPAQLNEVMMTISNNTVT